MNKLLVLIWALILLTFSGSFAQDNYKRIVSGVLRDVNGEPLPGVTIRIKGTDIGVSTDLEGRYKIEAPLNAVLVYSYIGFDSYEVLVTRSNSVPKNYNPAKDNDSDKKEPKSHNRTLPVKAEGEEEKGVAVLSDESPTYEIKGNNYGSWNQNNQHWRVYAQISKIRLKKKGKNGTYKILSTTYYNQQRPKIALEVNSAVSVNEVNKLPDLQQTYAQGRTIDGTLQWQESGPFSWGPSLADLRYDAEGNVVPKADERSPLQSFDSYKIFRKGYTTDNSINLFTELNDYKLKLGYANKHKAGILPNNELDRNTVDVSLSKHFYEIQPRLFFSYTSMEERLPLSGANMANVLSSIYLTPPSYDLFNGMGPKEAFKNSSSYVHADGSQRTFAPLQYDHPYWLLNTMPDQLKDQKLLTGLHFDMLNIYPFRINYSLLYDKEDKQATSGLAPGSSSALKGRLTQRDVTTTHVTSSFTPSVEVYLNSNWLSLDLLSSYLFSYHETELNRADGYGFNTMLDNRVEQAEILFERDASSFRRTHEIMGKAKFGVQSDYYKVLDVGIANRIYLSNTLEEDEQVYFLPTTSLTIYLNHFPFMRKQSTIQTLKFYSSFSKTVQEAPLIYNQWEYNSLFYPVSGFAIYFEQDELGFHEKLRPEEQGKFEAGFDLHAFQHIQLSFNYFHHATDQLIVPTFQNAPFQLNNVARLLNSGIDLALKAKGYFNKGDWNVKLNMSRARPVVKEIYGQQERVPIAGFQSVSMNLIEDQPYGILYGTRFKRNQDGKMIIGEDGFPVVAEDMGIIGNPNPDWLASVLGTLNMGHFNFFFQVDAKKGGQVWNGTQQFLNFYGASAESGEKRKTEGFIFDGVKADGTKNQTPVSFYDPAKHLTANRWVRYGVEGVAEEEVEDASWIRLNEVRVSYDFARHLNGLVNFREVCFSFIGKNLLTFSGYNGVDPVSGLFGYSNASGLDLFNQPNVRSYGFSLNIKL